MKYILLLIIGFITALGMAQQVGEPYRFEVELTKEVEAEKFEIQVPENRSNPDSRMIALGFVLLRSYSDTPGTPIMYLAGGPGSSGTRAMKGQRWLLFDALREVTDVIIFDQRGTGLSDDLPRCEASVGIPADTATTRSNYIRWHQAAAKECLAFWENRGIDIRGYTTKESAADIEAVRRELGVEKLSLLGISYGTHLALATLKYYPESIDRLVLASAEGVDHTVKLPSHTDAYFDRLQRVIDRNPESKALYPDVKKLIQSVLEKVEKDPVYLLVDDDPEFYHTLGKFEMQRITSYMISDPKYVPSLLGGYREAAEGNYRWFQNYLDWYVGDNSISFNGMALAMDLASGITEERLAQVNAEAKTALLGDATNFPMPHLRGVIDGIDLGEDFRSPFESDCPALILSGTLDGRTYPEAHREIASRFNEKGIVTIENAGHNLFFSHPDLPQVIVDFYRGASPEDLNLDTDPPEFLDN